MISTGYHNEVSLKQARSCFYFVGWVEESCSLKLCVMQALKPVASSFTLLITNIYRQRIGFMDVLFFLQSWRKILLHSITVPYLLALKVKSSSRTILRILTLNHLYKKFCDSGYCWVFSKSWPVNLLLKLLGTAMFWERIFAFYTISLKGSVGDIVSRSWKNISSQ